MTHPGLTAAREARAAGPGPGTEELRHAYLELLKLALCDLVGTTTGSVGRLEGGVVASRDLADDQLRLRSAGMDWPLYGLTMVGLHRLDDVQRCVESIVRDGIEGDLIEAGSWRGGASMLMRATLDSLGDERTLWVADSFQGFPESDDASDQWGAMDYLGVPVDEVRANFARLGLDHGIEWVEGFFQDTLPGLRGRRWSLVRLDGDSYESTRVALESLYPGLSKGGYMVIDDYGALEECRRAVDEFRTENGITEPLEEVDWTGHRWRKDAEPDSSAAEPEANGRPATRAVARRPGGHIPSHEELALTEQVADLRRQLEESQRQIARLDARPLTKVRSRVRRSLGR